MRAFYQGLVSDSRNWSRARQATSSDRAQRGIDRNFEYAQEEFSAEGRHDYQIRNRSETGFPRALLTGDRQQRGIELHERPFDRGVLGVAVDASRHLITGQGWCVRSGPEVEVRPAIRKPRVLHLGFDRDHAGLKSSGLVDRTFALGPPNLEHED